MGLLFASPLNPDHVQCNARRNRGEILWASVAPGREQRIFRSWCCILLYLAGVLLVVLVGHRYNKVGSQAKRQKGGVDQWFNPWRWCFATRRVTPYWEANLNDEKKSFLWIPYRNKARHYTDTWTVKISTLPHKSHRFWQRNSFYCALNIVLTIVHCPTLYVQ